MEGDGPLRIPPTPQPRRRVSTAPRWQKIAAFVVVVVMGAAGISAALNREVSRRLTTLPVVSTTTATSTTTTTTVTRRPRVLGVGNAPLSETTTTTEAPTPSTMLDAPNVPDEAERLIADLDKLAVSDEHPSGFRLARFGFWSDADGDGCTTPSEILMEQSTAPTRRTATCRVISGRWESPYDGLVITEGRDIAVDHVIALEEAWQSGAWKWNDRERNAFLNDLDNAGALLAVSARVNDEKGHKDPGQWLPPVAAFRCAYLRIWVDLKATWELAVDPGERESIAASALSCR